MLACKRLSASKEPVSHDCVSLLSGNQLMIQLVSTYEREVQSDFFSEVITDFVLWQMYQMVRIERPSTSVGVQRRHNLRGKDTKGRPRCNQVAQFVLIMKRKELFNAIKNSRGRGAAVFGYLSSPIVQGVLEYAKFLVAFGAESLGAVFVTKVF